MTVVDSKFCNLIEGSYTSNKGIYFFFNKLIVSEIFEHKHFDYDEGSEIIAIAKDYYGDISDISYISNRINTFSVAPTDWIKFFKNNLLKNYAIVTYDLASLKNAQLEKMFVSTDFKCFKTIDEAIVWSTKNQATN